MKIFEYILRKKYPVIGFIFGIAQMLVFILTVLMTDWNKVSDPIAWGVHFHVLIPCSILFCILLTISGCSYSKPDYTKPLRYAVSLSLVLSVIISLWMFIAAGTCVIEIFANIFVMFIIVSLFTLSAALLIGRN